MDKATAIKFLEQFNDSEMHTEEENFRYTEYLEYLWKETNDPCYICELGGYYYEIKKFDLALKYYEIAANAQYEPALSGLGYIWYYGRTGKTDYEKAFGYFQRSAELGNIQSEYKVADMYKNGYFVEKDYDKYKSIIEKLYLKVKDELKLFEPVPEIYTRLAAIRVKEGSFDEAVSLYYYARGFLSYRLRYSNFFGNLSIMKHLIHDLYKITPLDYDYFNLYDLYALENISCTVTFEYLGEEYEIHIISEDGSYPIKFNGQWYKTIDDFFAKASIDKYMLTEIIPEIDCCEVNIDGDNEIEQ